MTVVAKGLATLLSGNSYHFGEVFSKLERQKRISGAVMEVDSSNRVGGKRGYQSPSSNKDRPQSNQVCRFWKGGNCIKGDQCNWVHPGVPTAGSVAYEQHGGFANGRVSSSGWQSGSPGSFSGSKRPNSGRTGESQQNGSGSERWGRPRTGTYPRGGQSSRSKAQGKPCKFWLNGDCKRGATCTFLHTHATANDIEMMTELKGHTKAIREITLPANSNQLYTGSQDGTVRVWDCTTAQCTSVENMGDDMGSILIESGTLFVGLNGLVKMYNIATGSQGAVSEFPGLVVALKFFGGYLVAGCRDGTILVWKFNATSDVFEPLISLKGHSGAVTALEAYGSDILFSASIDKTIRVWEVSTGKHIQTLEEHSEPVTGLLCWSGHLFSCSLDGTVKVWFIDSASNQLVLNHTHNNSDDASASSGDRSRGVLAICASTDLSGKPVLLVAYMNSSVRLYELPTFMERGTLFTREDVRALHVAPTAQIIFTGDNSGEVKVWRWKQPSEGAVN